MRAIFRTLAGMAANYQWTGKVALILAVIAIYTGSYIGLRLHFTGNLINLEGYVVVQPPVPIASGANTIEMPVFGPHLPRLPFGLHKAINIFYYPARKLDLAATKRQMLFLPPFPVTPPHPNFYPTR